MPHLLKLHRIMGVKSKKNKKSKIVVQNEAKLLEEYIERELLFSMHSEERVEQKWKGKVIDYNKIKKGIAKSWDTTVFDKETGNIRVTYKGRWVINNCTVITYMNAISQTDKDTIKMHKIYHKYKPMVLQEIKNYWYNKVLPSTTS